MEGGREGEASVSECVLAGGGGAREPGGGGERRGRGRKGLQVCVGRWEKKGKDTKCGGF